MFHNSPCQSDSRFQPLALARISHKPSAARRPSPCLAASNRTICPQRIYNTPPAKLLVFLARQALTIARNEVCEKCGLGLLLLFSSCSRNEKPTTENEKDITSQLAADAQVDAIVDHLLLARKSACVTRALALHFPDLDREKSYQIQMALLAKLESQGERLVGWKMGGTKISESGKGLDPVFGFMLASNEFKPGSTLESNRFATGTPWVEAEVCFWIKRDLPGPEVSREELEAAIAGVGGASELISVRVRDAEGGIEAGVHLGIADGLSHGGFILPERQFPLDQANFRSETGRVVINDEVRAEGAANQMMNGAPLDAVLALANELPKYGRHLRAGDVVIIGSMLESPPAQAGDHVEIIFSSFGSLNFTLE